MENEKDEPTLYNHSNYKDLQWPLEAQYEHDYILPLLSKGSQEYVSNVQTHLQVLNIAKHLLPLTVNDAEYDNSYVCSFFTRYITYAKEELLILNNRLLRSVLFSLIDCLGVLLKAGNINQAACVNNWLLSTNLYPHLDGISIKNLTQFLITSFPKHTLVFPSLNHHTNASLMELLQNNGYLLVPSREVFIFDKALKDYSKRRITQTDFDLLKKTPYRVVSHQEITEKDYDRIVELYNLLYIQKYSNCNPKFSAAFIKLCHQKNLLNFQGLRRSEGDLVGIIASFNRDKVLATPLLGYDTQLPLKDGLYRLLTVLSMKEAIEKKFIFNMSGGASEFKKWRGGVGFVEYNAVYYRHLPIYRRQLWHLLHFMMTEMGVPLLRKYKF